MKLLEQRFGCPIVEASAAEAPHTISVAMKDRGPRPVFDDESAVYQTPAEIDVFAHFQFFPESAQFKEDILAHSQTAGRHIEEPISAARVLVHISHMKR
jgi:hypothetical protein